MSQQNESLGLGKDSRGLVSHRKNHVILVCHNQWKVSKTENRSRVFDVREAAERT